MKWKVTAHAKQRTKERHIALKKVDIAVQQGERCKLKGGLVKAVKDGVEVVANAKTKTIITVYSTPTKQEKGRELGVCRFCHCDFQRYDLMLRHINRKHRDLIH